MKSLAVMLAFTVIISGLASMSQAQYDELILRVAMQDDLKTTNPLTAGDVWTWNVIGYLYDEPLKINPDTDELIPYIAVGSAASSTSLDYVDWTDCDIGEFDYTSSSSWNSNNGEAVIFYDFEDVYWHDGERMDIRDIMFSMHATAMNPDWSSSMNCLKDDAGRNLSNYSRTSWLSIQKVWESSDGLQAALKFVLTEQYNDFFRNTLSTFLLPEHIWAYKVSGQNVDIAKIWFDHGYNVSASNSWKLDLAQIYDNPEPVGSGPFKWDYWEVDQLSKITTYRDHFYKSGYKYENYCLDADDKSLARQPNIDGIVYKIYKTAEAAVMALRNDDIDYIAWTVPPTFVRELAKEPGVALSQSSQSGFEYLAYNMRRESFGYNEDGNDTGKPLRQAIAHCIDKNRINSRINLNFGIAGEGPICQISEWFNDSIPRYGFDPDGAIDILRNANYTLENPDEYPGPTNHWSNPDGSPIGSVPGGVIEILTPEANYDPIVTQPGLMIAEQLQDIGINARSVAMDFGSIVNQIDQRDFDMYMLNWRIGSDPTDFLHAFFHSSQAEEGQNYPGYLNESFDEIIDLARQTDDEEVRLKAIFDAQASIVYDLPYDVLYYRNNIEAYRSDRFTGWVVGDTGSIFNLKSIYNIRAPSPYKVMAQFVSPPSAVVSNSATQITVFVKDQDGNPLQGAYVLLNASMGIIDHVHANTTSTGKATFTFTAPYVDHNDDDAMNNGIKVTIQIESATYEKNGMMYNPAPSRLTLITVYSEGVPFLSVSMSADPDVIDPDISYDGTTLGFTHIEVEVTYQNGEPVQGAIVAISVSPATPSLDPAYNTTDAEGKAVFKFTSIDEPNDDDYVREYVVTAYAEHPTDLETKPGDNSISVYVVDKDLSPPPPLPPEITHWNEIIMIASGIFLAVVIIIIFGRSRGH
ncbi:MAG: Ig-like domain-containing protein [Thermoplasmata archaeon]|nr:Ig-like domain-containing protein [Thermoplasmata archaeon]